MDSQDTLEQAIAQLRKPWAIDMGPLLKAVHRLEDLGESAVPSLVELASGASERPHTRVWATITIGGIAKKHQLQAATSALLHCLRSGEAAVRRAAIRALGHLKDPAHVPLIAAHLSDNAVDSKAWEEDDSTVRHSAIQALRELGTAEAIQALHGAGIETAT